MSSENESVGMHHCAHCGAFSGPELLCSKCDLPQAIVYDAPDKWPGEYILVAPEGIWLMPADLNWTIPLADWYRGDVRAERQRAEHGVEQRIIDAFYDLIPL